jgi:hypothetical protein
MVQEVVVSVRCLSAIGGDGDFIILKEEQSFAAQRAISRADRLEVSGDLLRNCFKKGTRPDSAVLR